MRVLVLGHGKTGKLVASVAAERGHSVHVLDAKENPNAQALTHPFVAGFDVVIDFTTPDAAVQNMRACLATGARMVIGTTGWYEKLADMRGLAERRGGALLYGTNFSVGMQIMFQLAAQLGTDLKTANFSFRIEETHHTSKLDTPSGTSLSIAEVVKSASDQVEVPITSNREGEETGMHVLVATSEDEQLTLKHESFTRRAFAEGAVRAAEWVSSRTGCFDFREVFTKL